MGTRRRRPKIVHVPTGAEPVFVVCEHVPGLNYWQFKIADAIVGDEPVFRYTPPKKGNPFTPDDLARAAAGELNEGVGRIVTTEFKDGIPVFTAIYVSNGLQVFCVQSTDMTRAQPVDVTRIQSRARRAFDERRQVTT